MKPALQSCPKRARTAGFTLVEIYIVSAIFLVLVGAMLALQIFGLQIYTLAATKLTATAGGRKTLNEIRDAVREAKLVDVGLYTNGSTTFNSIGTGTNQIGNALLIFTNNSATTGTLYFEDQASKSLLQSNHDQRLIQHERVFIHRDAGRFGHQRPVRDQLFSFRRGGLSGQRPDEQQQQPHHPHDAAIFAVGISGGRRGQRRDV